jgi:fructosamine-3-kinase
MIPSAVKSWLKENGFGEVINAQAVGGGCINHGARLKTSSGDRFFVKSNLSAPFDMFEREAQGLEALAAGAGPVIDCDQPEAEVALFLGEEEDVVLVLSHSPEPMTATLTAERVVASVADIRGGKPAAVGAKAFGVPLTANGAVGLRLTYG